jgi:PHD/YefM family antitoxin component YafN of YafNO toxin-antitoxin module
MISAIVPVQEIKRRGMSAVDSGLRTHRAVTIVRNNRPAYVVVAPDDYAELVRAADGAHLAEALADWKAGRCKATSADELMAEAEADE